jgi:hypothetical protein
MNHTLFFTLLFISNILLNHPHEHFQYGTIKLFHQPQLTYNPVTIFVTPTTPIVTTHDENQSGIYLQSLDSYCFKPLRTCGKTIDKSCYIIGYGICCGLLCNRN